MMVSIRSVVTALVMVLYCCCHSVRTANGFLIDKLAGTDGFPFSNAVVRRVPMFYATTPRARVSLQSSKSVIALKSSVRDMMTLPMVPFWPYLGCSGRCGGGPLGLFLALALCGVGLPLSEDVLLIGLAPRLLGAECTKMPLAYKVLHFLAAVAGVATADTLTVLTGRALRVNSKVLGDKAPGVLGRMLVAIRKQLVVESKRDNDRLREQIDRRLRSATIDLGEQLRRLQQAIVPDPRSADDGSDRSSTPPKISVWQRLKASNDFSRRITCNTRTSLAAWGQTAAALTKIVTSRSNQRNRSSSIDPSSRLAGIDNRIALGQRWPLALLTGFSADPEINYRCYFTGAMLAAVTFTVPVQLLLGFALQGWARKFAYLLIALAQLCRYGPIWAAVFVAIADTVKTEIEDARMKKKKGRGG